MNSIVSNEKKCLVCGMTYRLEKHHVFYGFANRRKSDQDGAWVWLCHAHHTGFKYAVHTNQLLDDRIKQITERRWIKRYGTEEDFMRRFGRTWLTTNTET